MLAGCCARRQRQCFRVSWACFLVLCSGLATDEQRASVIYLIVYWHSFLDLCFDVAHYKSWGADESLNFTRVERGDRGTLTAEDCESGLVQPAVAIGHAIEKPAVVMTAADLWGLAA